MPPYESFYREDNKQRERCSQSQNDNYMSGLTMDLEVSNIITWKLEKYSTPKIITSLNLLHQDPQRVLWWHHPMFHSRGSMEGVNSNWMPK